MAVTHTDRQILGALGTLDGLEKELQEKLSYSEAGDVITKIDELITALNDLVSRRSQSKNSDTRSLDAMKQELAREEQTRSVSQQNADRCGD